MTDEETMKEICEIIRKLHAHSTVCWNKGTNIHKAGIPDDLHEFYEYLLNNESYLIMDLEYRLRESIKPNKLSLYIDGETSEGEKRGRLYLPPFEEEPQSIAMLSLNCDLSQPTKKIDIRIDVITLFEGEPYGIGYRFERGEHEFFHVSLTNKRPDSEGGDHLRNAPKWLPCKIPRVPMRADEPVALLTDALISFYGPQGYAVLSS
jgi:hypothetical protein